MKPLSFNNLTSLEDDEIQNIAQLAETICYSLIVHFDILFKATDGFKSSKDFHLDRTDSESKFKIFKRTCLSYLLCHPKRTVRVASKLRGLSITPILESLIQRIIDPEELLRIFSSQSDGANSLSEQIVFERILKCLEVFVEYFKEGAVEFCDKHFPLQELTETLAPDTKGSRFLNNRPRLRDQGINIVQRSRKASKAHCSASSVFAQVCSAALGLNLVSHESSYPLMLEYFSETPRDAACEKEFAEYLKSASARMTDPLTEYLTKYQQKSISDKDLAILSGGLQKTYLEHQTFQKLLDQQSRPDSMADRPVTKFAIYRELVMAALSDEEMALISNYQTDPKCLQEISGIFERILALSGWFHIVMLNGANFI